MVEKINGEMCHHFLATQSTILLSKWPVHSSKYLGLSYICEWVKLAYKISIHNIPFSNWRNLFVDCVVCSLKMSKQSTLRFLHHSTSWKALWSRMPCRVIKLWIDFWLIILSIYISAINRVIYSIVGWGILTFISTDRQLCLLDNNEQSSF